MSSPVTGHRGRRATTKMRCADVAALFAAAILRRNPDSVIVPFDTQALNALFSYAEPLLPQNDALYSVKYRGQVKHKRVAIVNDVINAGSAVRGTFFDLKECGAEPVVIGALLVLRSAAREFAVENSVMLESLAALPSTLWTPAECPLCPARVPLDNLAG